MSVRLATILSAFVLNFVAAGAAFAGPLDPPAGAVGGTMKTLAEVEPRTVVNAVNTPGNAGSVFRITQPGSYYLTSNITVPDGLMGIAIITSNVTLDLNGFEISGGDYGVWSGLGSEAQIVVRNGSVANTVNGVRLQGRRHCTVESVRVTNAQQGIWAGSDCRIVSCDVDGGVTGITTGPRCIIRECAVSNTSGIGIHVQDYCQVIDCTVFSPGTIGISVGRNAEVRNSFVNWVGFGAGGKGILANSGSLVTACRVVSAATGIELTGTGATVSGSSVAECHIGFKLAEGGVAEGCTAETNSQVGFDAGPGSVLRNCHSRSNGQQGFRVRSHCVVTGCHASQNGTTGQYAGFWINGSECRVEDNHAARNGYGFWVDGTDNFIVRNTARGNTGLGFTVPAGNDIAPVINNPGSTFTGATPWSNFAF